MADNVDYKLGDVANGHVLTEQGWVALQKQVRMPKALGLGVAALLGFVVVGAVSGGADSPASGDAGADSLASKDVGVDYDSLNWNASSEIPGLLNDGFQFALVPYEKAAAAGLECDTAASYCYHIVVQAPPEGCSNLSGRAYVVEEGSSYWPMIDWEVGVAAPGERAIVKLPSETSSGRVFIKDVYCMPPTGQ